MDWGIPWREGVTPWDLGTSHPGLERVLEKISDEEWLASGSRFYVPGCGRAHDAALLCEFGYSVYGEDIVPEAITQAKKEYGEVEHLDLKVADVFHPSKEGGFDAIYDRAMLCALSPKLWKPYIEAILKRLDSRGLLISIPFTKVRKGTEGPPFAISQGEFKSLLGKDWETLYECVVPNHRVNSSIEEEYVYVGVRR